MFSISLKFKKTRQKFLQGPDPPRADRSTRLRAQPGRIGVKNDARPVHVQQEKIIEKTTTLFSSIVHRHEICFKNN